MAEQQRALVLAAVLCTLVVLTILGPLVRRYGTGVLFGPSAGLALSEDEHLSLLKSHRFVVIGGPHRGGTTIFWRLLAEHPSISGFPEKGLTTDFGEGSCAVLCALSCARDT
jgi:hypothetical protein